MRDALYDKVDPNTRETHNNNGSLIESMNRNYWKWKQNQI